MPKTQNIQSLSHFRLPWWALVLIFLFLALALFGKRGVLKVMDTSRHNGSLQAEIQKLEGRNEALQKEIKALRSDKKFIEDIARKDLGMAGDNEVIYVFPQNGSGENGQLSDVDKDR